MHGRHTAVPAALKTPRYWHTAWRKARTTGSTHHRSVLGKGVVVHSVPDDGFNHRPQTIISVELPFGSHYFPKINKQGNENTHTHRKNSRQDTCLQGAFAVDDMGVRLHVRLDKKEVHDKRGSGLMHISPRLTLQHEWDTTSCIRALLRAA